MDLPDYVRSTLGHAQRVPTTTVVVASFFELALFFCLQLLGAQPGPFGGRRIPANRRRIRGRD